MSVHKHPETGEVVTQTVYLKAIGRHGSSRDPKWNRETKQHDCCGAKRPYYHNAGCPLCVDVDDDLSDLKETEVPRIKVTAKIKAAIWETWEMNASIIPHYPDYVYLNDLTSVHNRTNGSRFGGQYPEEQAKELLAEFKNRK